MTAKIAKQVKIFNVQAESEKPLPTIIQSHRWWILNNRQGTVGQLLERMQTCTQQCSDIASAEADPQVSEYDDVPEPLYSELQQWDNSESNCTFSYREANFEEFANELESLAEDVGLDAVLADVIPYLTKDQLLQALRGKQERPPSSSFVNKLPKSGQFPIICWYSPSARIVRCQVLRNLDPSSSFFWVDLPLKLFRSLGKLGD